MGYLQDCGWRQLSRKAMSSLSCKEGPSAWFTHVTPSLWEDVHRSVRMQTKLRDPLTQGKETSKMEGAGEETSSIQSSLQPSERWSGLSVLFDLVWICMQERDSIHKSLCTLIKLFRPDVWSWKIPVRKKPPGSIYISVLEHLGWAGQRVSCQMNHGTAPFLGEEG